MRGPLVVAALLLSLSTLQVQANQTSSEAKGSKPDYSKGALLEFVAENVDLEAGNEEGFDVDMGIVYRKGHWLFRYVPIIAPLVVSNAPGTNASLMPTVDPFVMLRTSIPYTNSTFRDRWDERRIRRELRRNVDAANRAENR